MQVGICLPQIGPHVTPTVVRQFAAFAEDAGFATLWVQEHHLLPEDFLHRDPPRGHHDKFRTSVTSATELLLLGAAVTSHIKIGTSVIVLPLHNPVEIAKRLATLDLLSGGRLIAGFGLGWCQEEYIAAGVPWEERGRRFDEALEAVQACWGPDPVEYTGTYYTIPQSRIGPKPVQQPRPPIIIATASTPGLRRTARVAEGWHPSVTSSPMAKLRREIVQLREECARLGREPLPCYYRMEPWPEDVPAGAARRSWQGRVEQMGEEIAEMHEIGMHELVIELNFFEGIQSESDWLRALERIAPLVEAVK